MRWNGKEEGFLESKKWQREQQLVRVVVGEKTNRSAVVDLEGLGLRYTGVLVVDEA
jgi:hypothetical protein